MGFHDFILSWTLFCRDMSPSDAKKVALGDVDPVTLLRMEDINSTFVPRVPLNLNVLKNCRQDHGKGKGKAAGKSASEGILHFFGKYIVIISLRQSFTFSVAPKQKATPKSSSQPVQTAMVVGNASGKRTLADAMDQDLAAKKKQREQSLTAKKPNGLTESRFFGAKPSIGTPNHEEDSVAPIAGPSRVHDFLEVDKENVPMSDEDLDFTMDIPEDPVTQEDGYLSPTPSFSRLDTPEFSSPLRPGVRRKRETDDDFDAEALSSPEASRQAPRRHSYSIERLEWSRGKILTPVTSDHSAGADETLTKDGLDLRDILDDDMTSEIDCFDEDTFDPTPPITPDGSGQKEVAPEVDYDIDGLKQLEAVSVVTRTEIVASGWWEKWGRTGKVKEEKSRVRL